VFELAIANFRANLSRLVATVVAIIAGVAFLSAGLMFTDALRSSLGGAIAEQYAHVDAAVQGPSDSEGPPVGVPAALVGQIEGVDGVATAAGELVATTGIFEDGRSKPDEITGRSWITEQRLNPTDIVSGRAPRSAGEVTIDRRTADDQGVEVGDRVKLSTTLGPKRFEVVGTTSFGDDDAQDGNGTVTFSAGQSFDALNSGVEEYTRILVEAADGTSGSELVGNLRAEFRGNANIDVRTRQEFLDDAAGAAAIFAKILRPILIGFSLLALFVCGFVIANTFAVVVAQRTRELALLRAIGATPRQVKRSLRVEAASVGLLSSIVGLIVGAALAAGATAVLAAFDIRLPGAGVKLTPFTVIAGLLAGTVVTVVSVSGASRRAAKIAPVEAMRSGIIDRKVGVTGVVNRLVGLAIGLALLIWGSLGGPGWILGVGAFVFTISVLRCGGVLARLAARIARPVARRVGVEGRLATDNIDRSAKRAATTANALVIGVLLITLVTTAGGTLKRSLLDEVDSLSTADITVISVNGLPADLVSRMRDVKGVDALAEVRLAPVVLDGQQIRLSTSDPKTLLRATGLDTLAGSVGELGDDGITAIGAKPGKPNQCSDGGPEPRIGDRQQVTLVDGTTETFVVRAILECKLDFSTFVVGHLVSPQTFQRIAGDVPASQAFVRVEGRSADKVTDDLERITDTYPAIRVVEGNFIGQILESVFDFLIAGVNGLLGMSVFIAIIGIVNTMTLSVLERRREIGLLRAVGMFPSEARRMVRYESVIIGLLGTVVGMISGVALAFLLINAADDVGDFSFEWPRLLIILVLGVLVGIVASWLPGRRVSRLNVLEALEP
jgi:putative ABC transport system permease protein